MEVTDSGWGPISRFQYVNKERHLEEIRQKKREGKEEFRFAIDTIMIPGEQGPWFLTRIATTTRSRDIAIASIANLNSSFPSQSLSFT